MGSGGGGGGRKSRSKGGGGGSGTISVRGATLSSNMSDSDIIEAHVTAMGGHTGGTDEYRARMKELVSGFKKVGITPETRPDNGKIRRFFKRYG